MYPKIILILLLLMMVMVGCDEDNSVNVPESYLELSIDSTEFSAIGLDRLTIGNINGEIDINPSVNNFIYVTITKYSTSENPTDAELYLDSIIVNYTIDSGILTYSVSLPNDTGLTCQVDFEVQLPPDISTQLYTANGFIRVDSLQSIVELSAINGSLSIFNHNGSVNAELTNGNIACNIDQLVSSDTLYLFAVNGDVNLTIPELTSTTFDCRASNGTASVSGFPNVTYTFNETDRKTGFIGSGAADISLKSNNGSVSLTGI